MVRLRLLQLLKRRKMTRYRLAKVSGLSLPHVYQLARPDGHFARLEAETIEKLCAALRCKPGDLIVRD
jgi:DNA-binding Xre family transcriptional regulator